MEANAARLRLAALERALGDPADRANPVGRVAVLAAEQEGLLPAGGEAALAGFGLHEEFVPADLGGRLRDLEVPALLLRAVARRDFALGLSYGGASLVPAAAVWCHGSDAQQERISRLLLDGERLSVAFHAVAHGNDFSASNVWARHGGAPGLVLGGRKRVVTNAPRAAAFVVIARTGRGPAGDSYTAVLVDRAAVPAGSVRDLPAVDGAGPHRCPSGGVEFLDCAVPEDAVIGRIGEGTAVMLRALHLTRSIAPSMGVGCADSALRASMTLAGLDDHAPRDLSKAARRALSAAFLDLLICDSLLMVSARAVNALPDWSNLASAAAKYLVPTLLRQAVTGLTPVAASGHATRGDEALRTFRKHARDVGALPPGHVGSAASLAAILPQLPVLARRYWAAEPGHTDTPFDLTRAAALFEPFGPLPSFDPALLSAAARCDPLADILNVTPGLVREQLGSSGPAGLEALAAALSKSFTELRDECRALPPGDPEALATPRAFALAERYALSAAAAACVGVWSRAAAGGESGFLAEPDWLAGALTLICRRLSLPAGEGDRAASWEDAVLDEAAGRYAAGRALDLYATDLGRNG